MKNLFYFFAFIAVVLSTLLLSGCKKKDATSSQDTNQSSVNPKNLPSSGGKTLEMILVSPDEVYKGELRDSIGTYFLKACEGIANPEPLFDIVQMLPKTFYNSEMFQKHRNIFVIDYSPTNTENVIFQNIDFKSFPQAYFQIIANNIQHII